MIALPTVKRFDDLGRIHIPKEIRTEMKIFDGTPMEVYFNPEDGTILLKKHVPCED